MMEETTVEVKERMVTQGEELIGRVPQMMRWMREAMNPDLVVEKKALLSLFNRDPQAYAAASITMALAEQQVTREGLQLLMDLTIDLEESVAITRIADKLMSGMDLGTALGKKGVH